MAESMKTQAVKGVAWSAIERFSMQGVQFVLTIVISRLVAPSEYGLIAMLGIFMSLAQWFIDSGFSNALIQKKDRTEIDFSTVFYFNIVVAVMVYLLLFGIAPCIAAFYNEPLLKIITRWVGLNIVISAFSIVQRAKLTIQMDFKIQAQVSFFSVVLSGVCGLIMAYKGFGVWALVMQGLLGSILNTLFIWVFSRWMPGWCFSWRSFRLLFSFGSKLMLSGLLHTIYLNLYTLVIGRSYSAADVGFYNRSLSIAQFPSQTISGIITRVIYPLQCEMQHDAERLSQSFLQYLRMSCYIIFPLSVGIGVLSRPLVLVLLTEKWIPIAFLIFTLCVAYMWYPVMVVNNQMLNVRGRSDYFLREEVIKKIAAIAILIVTMPFGVKVLCWGLVFYNLLDMVIGVYYTKKVITTGFGQQIRALLPAFLLTAAMGGVVSLFLLMVTNVYVQLVGGVLVGLATYALLSYLFRVKEIGYLLSYIQKK